MHYPITERLALRPWQDQDAEVFHRLTSDAQITSWLLPLSRSESEALFARVRERLAHERWGVPALVKRDQPEQVLGFVGIQPAALEPVLPAGTLELLWRLLPEHWHQGYVTEMARALVAASFSAAHAPHELVAFTVPANRASQAVMQRLGMQRDPAGDFIHPRVPADQPQLRQHLLYRLPRPV